MKVTHIIGDGIHSDESEFYNHWLPCWAIKQKLKKQKGLILYCVIKTTT